MSLNNTVSNSVVDLIESCNFIDDTAPEAILLAHNEFLNIKKNLETALTFSAICSIIELQKRCFCNI